MLEVPENSVLAGKKLAVKLEISGGGAGGFDRVMLSHTLHPTPSPTFASSDKPTLSPTESKISLRPTKVPSVRLTGTPSARPIETKTASPTEKSAADARRLGLSTAGMLELLLPLYALLLFLH